MQSFSSWHYDLPLNKWTEIWKEPVHYMYLKTLETTIVCSGLCFCLPWNDNLQYMYNYIYACIGDQNAHVKSKIKIIYNFLSSTSLIINTYIIFLQMNNLIEEKTIKHKSKKFCLVIAIFHILFTILWKIICILWLKKGHIIQNCSGIGQL